MSKNALKTLLSALSPTLARRIEAYRIRRHIAGFERSMGLPRLQAAYLAEHGNTVQSGPFRGLHYLPYACGSSHLPKLLGSYEKELHPVILETLDRNPRRVIDIGAAEGYYAVGYAMRLPNAQVIAFDTDPKAKKACRGLASLNQVSQRLSVQDACDAETLLPHLCPNTLLFCDCEGFEYKLLEELDPSNLATIDLIVELHKNPVVDPEDWFESRFDKTHDVSFVRATDRILLDRELDFLSTWTERDKLLAANEFRNDGFLWGYARSRIWKSRKEV